MGPLALPGKVFMERAQVLWNELGLAPLKLQQPWHGYSLGDWTERWTQFAHNGVSGAWAANGDDTLARRRGGLTPETPARLVEEPPDS
jgi:4-hydroxy-3-polyprenylbenzoate decarboxylase